jgi:uncharacterized protein (TIGR03435 family)
MKIRMKIWIAALLLGTAAIAQTPDPGLVFEVASLRPAAPRPVVPYPNVGMINGGPGTPDPGQIDYTNIPMRQLLQLAYGLQQTFQLSAPAWVEDTRFDIVAKVPVGATKDQFQVMLQNLLADRLGLAVHHEARDFLGYEMVIAQGGPNVKESADAPGDPTVLKTEQGRDGFPQLAPGSAALMAFALPNGSTRDSARQQPMSVLTWLLAKALGKPVVDKTGLSGKYDFNLTFVRDERTSANIVGNPPDLFTAMQQQLGLRFEQRRIATDVVVVDRAETTPKDN